VHLIAAELFEQLRGEGHVIRPGDLGENITTRGVDLLSLPRGTRLALGSDAVVEVTGLRNPCGQIDRFQPGLRAKVLERHDDGTVERRVGVMGVVVTGGVVRIGDPLAVELPAGPRVALEVV
jgi:MOSC domain-containing protein YiiM